MAGFDFGGFRCGFRTVSGCGDNLQGIGVIGGGCGVIGRELTDFARPGRRNFGQRRDGLLRDSD